MKNPYTILGWLAIVAVPISPVFFFGWKVHTEVFATSQSLWLSAPVGLLSAIGLEIIGILAGHLAMEFWRSGNMSRAYVAAGIMGVYVIIGVWELWGTVGAVMFIIAPLVYVLVALRQVADQEATEHARNEKRSIVIDYRAKEAAAQRDHEARLRKMELDAEVKKEKIHAPVSLMVSRKPEETAEPKKETMERVWKPGMKPTELATLAGVSKGYASKYINNGAMDAYQRGRQS